MANRPERSEAFILDEDAGEKKVEYVADTKMINAGASRNPSFIFLCDGKEDHTVGNLLRMQLLRDPRGYMLPHPLIHLVRLKLQTNSSAVSPIEVLSAAIEDLGNETDYLTEKATDAIAKWRKENASGGVMDQF